MVAPSQDLIAGRYRLGPSLGRGGMAVVRAAEDLRLGRDVAVKLLLPDLSADQMVRARFEAEARTAARLSHPNVVIIHDTGEDGETAFIVMERLPGRTLADELGEAPMAPARVIAVGSQVLAALAAAHDLGIIHRDVKPSNVLTTPDGNVKVTDFGIATITGDAGGLTTSGTLLGTPAYLAPERLEGLPASPESDIYSVGALLYECLTGRKPFEAETPLALVAAIQKRVPVAVRALRPEVDEQLSVVVERAMQKNPALRFSSAREMAAMLENLDRPPPMTAAAVTQVLGSPARDREETDPPGSLDRTRTLRDADAGPGPGARSQLTRTGRAGRRSARRTIWVAVLSAALLAGLLFVIVSVTTGALPSRSTPPSTSVHRPAAKPLPAPLARALENLVRSIGQ